jgi:hypothetical protein
MKAMELYLINSTTTRMRRKKQQKAYPPNFTEITLTDAAECRREKFTFGGSSATPVGCLRLYPAGNFLGFLFFLISLFSLPLTALSQDENSLAGRLAQELVKDGFENVAVVQENQDLIVTYENRRFRDELAAAKEVIAAILSLAKEELNVTLIPQNRKIPLVAIHLDVNKGAETANGKSSTAAGWAVTEVNLDFAASWKKLQAIPRANASTWKIDVAVHPQVHAEFATYNNPVAPQINLAPALNTSLWKGMSILAQLIFPLYNELEKEGDYVRPGLLAVNQVLRLPRNIFVSASIGYFTQNRYGFDIEAQKYFLNGRASVGANWGYTGYASYFKGTWSYSPVEHQIMLLNSEFRLPRFDLSLRATYGKFLYQDTAWRVDLVRQFKEADFGFFVLRSEGETNTGFHFSVPIFPPKHLRAGRARIRTAEYFTWEYRYKGFPDSGVLYDTGNRIHNFMKRLNPNYVKNQVRYYDRWKDLNSLH